MLTKCIFIKNKDSIDLRLRTKYRLNKLGSKQKLNEIFTKYLIKKQNKIWKNSNLLKYTFIKYSKSTLINAIRYKKAQFSNNKTSEI